MRNVASTLPVLQANEFVVTKIGFGPGTEFASPPEAVTAEPNYVEIANSAHTDFINVVSRCNFIGATTHFANTRLDKLFSYHLLSLKDYNNYLASLIANHRIGSSSAILDLEEEFIEEALQLAHEQNINCEPSGIAGLALLLQSRNDIPKEDKILIVNTGRTNYSIRDRR